MVGNSSRAGRKVQLVISLGGLAEFLTYFLDLGIEVDGSFDQFGEFYEKIVEV